MAKARMMKCTGCEFLFDITETAPGSVLACPSCSVKVRVPTGNTVIIPKQPGTTAQKAGAVGTQQLPKSRTATFAKKTGTGSGTYGRGQNRQETAPPKKSNTLYIVMAIAGVVVIAVILILVFKGDNKAPEVEASGKKGKKENAGGTADILNTANGMLPTTPKSIVTVVATPDGKKKVVTSGKAAETNPSGFQKPSEFSMTLPSKIEVTDADRTELRNLLSKNDSNSITENWERFYFALPDFLITEEDEDIVKRSYAIFTDLSKKYYSTTDVGKVPLSEYLVTRKPELNSFTARVGIYATLYDVKKMEKGSGHGANPMGVSKDQVYIVMDRLLGDSKLGIQGEYPKVSVMSGSDADVNVIAYLKGWGRPAFPHMIDKLEEILNSGDSESGIDIDSAQQIVKALTLLSGVGRDDLWPSARNQDVAKALPAKWRKELNIK